MPPDSQKTSDSSDRESVLSFHQSPLKSRQNSVSLKYKCSIAGCNKRFKRLDHLDRHEYYHTGVKKHACYHDGCDKVYSIFTHLKRHLRSTHERSTPLTNSIPCEVEECSKMFTSVNNMHRHVRQAHQSPKIYNCSHCEEKFSQKVKMRRHEISKHTGEYPFKCSKCSKGFYQKWQCDKHIPTCKIYPCPACDERFEKWSLYVKHSKETQHGRKYHACEHCSRVYSKPSDLQKHVNGQHADEDSKIVFKCSEEGCEKSYSYERNLRQHMRTAHSGERFVCEHEGCSHSFSSSQNLLKHIEREHHNALKRKLSGKEECEEKQNKSNPPRKKRKDAGEPKQSQLAKLSGLAIEPKLDKLLRERRAEALSAVGEQLSATAVPLESDDTMSDLEHFSATVPKKPSTEPLSNDEEFRKLVEMAFAST